MSPTDPATEQTPPPAAQPTDPLSRKARGTARAVAMLVAGAYDLDPATVTVETIGEYALRTAGPRPSRITYTIRVGS